MSAGRTSGLLVALGLTAMALVFLRAEQIRGAAQTLAVERETIELRRELWRLQVAVARLRAPHHVHDWMDLFQTGTLTPEMNIGGSGRSRVAFGRIRE